MNQKYAETWRKNTMETPNLRMGTKAFHKMGDISRDEPDFFVVHEEDEENYYGNWVTGFGFIGVRFPKETSRELSEYERLWLADNPAWMH